MNLVGKLHIDGIFEGRISSLDSVTVGRRGVVRGVIQAQQISVSGAVDAAVHCDELTIERDGRVHGVVHSRQLTIHKRGHFIGERVMTAESALKSLAVSDPSDAAGDRPNLLAIQDPSLEITDLLDVQDSSLEIDEVDRFVQPQASAVQSDKLTRMLDEMLGEMPKVGNRSDQGAPR